MTVVIGSLAQAVESFKLEDDTLYGVRFIPSFSWPGADSDGAAEVDTTGMFALEESRASFRARFAVRAEPFKELWIDVASNYLAPSDYEIPKDVMLEFANGVAGPHLRAYAQGILNTLLTNSQYPPGVLPSIEELSANVFQGELLGDVLGPAAMPALKDREELRVPDPEPFPSTET